MSTAAFALIAFILTAYVMLDGYDLGVASVAPLLAKSEAERGMAMASIGPFWNGNEVWLIVAGGALFALFPLAYAVVFSGFYLPFMVVLWLLMFRGIAMELRGHLASDLWRSFWDVAFSASSLLLIFVFGIALGNLLRGVPLGPDGYFQGTFAFLLNPFALLIGAFAVLVLGTHGAAWLGMRVEGALAQRAQAFIQRAWWVELLAFLGVTAVAFASLGLPTHAPWLFAIPLLSLIALVALGRFARSRRAVPAFVASSAFIVTLLVEAAGTLFPYLLAGFPLRGSGVSIYAAAPSPVALGIAFAVTALGALVVVIYATLVFRGMMKKVGA